MDREVTAHVQGYGPKAVRRALVRFYAPGSPDEGETTMTEENTTLENVTTLTLKLEAIIDDLDKIYDQVANSE